MKNCLALKQNAEEVEKKARRAQRKQTHVPQIQEWEVLQKDEAALGEVSVPVRQQEGGGGWFGWLFGGTPKEAKESK